MPASVPAQPAPPSINRRDFMKGNIACAALTLDPSPLMASSLSIDAHAHVFTTALKPAPVVRYVPSYDAPVARYLEALDANGIDRGVIIQPSFLGTDNSYLAESLVAAKGRLRAVAVVDPTIAEDELKRLGDVGVIGARLNLIGRPLPDLKSPEWRAHLAILARLDWQVEVHCPAKAHVALAPTLLDAGVNLVIDHFGLPDPQTGADDPYIEQLIALGASRRLWFKLSASYRLGPNGAQIAKLLYVKLKAAIGLDRLLWGSDWPNTQFEDSQSYRDNRAYLDQLVPDPAERGQILRSGGGLFRF